MKPFKKIKYFLFIIKKTLKNPISVFEKCNKGLWYTNQVIFNYILWCKFKLILFMDNDIVNKNVLREKYKFGVPCFTIWLLVHTVPSIAWTPYFQDFLKFCMANYLPCIKLILNFKMHNAIFFLCFLIFI